jgi:hypothetical protein
MNANSSTNKHYFCYTCTELVKDLPIHALNGHHIIEAEVIDNFFSLKVRFRLYTLLMYYITRKELYQKIAPLFQDYGEFITQDDFIRIIKQSMKDEEVLLAMHGLEMLCLGVVELIRKDLEVKKLEQTEKRKEMEKEERRLDSHRKAVIKHREKKRQEKEDNSIGKIA